MSEPGSPVTVLSAPTGQSFREVRDHAIPSANSPAKLAMWLFLCSDAISFAAVLATYGFLRAESAVWRHVDEPALDMTFTAGLTFVLLCSSVTMLLARDAALQSKPRELVRYLALTLAGGVIFLVGQCHEYFGFIGPGLVNRGMVLGGSPYANTFYVVTGFHGLHVLAGVCYLIAILLGARRGRYLGHSAGAVELAGLFWHFVDLVWAFVFTLVYLLPTA